MEGIDGDDQKDKLDCEGCHGPTSTPTAKAVANPPILSLERRKFWEVTNQGASSGANFTMSSEPASWMA
jgi:hypothetical protein